MSWVDLAALTIMLWSSAKGYLCGFRQILAHFCGLGVALLVAVFLQKPFSLYLSLEWQADTFFARLASPHVEELLKAGSTGSPQLQLPPLAGSVMRRLAEGNETLAVFGWVAAPQELGEMIMRLFAVVVFFFFFAVTVSLILRVAQSQLKSKIIPEGQRFLGLLLGLVHGLLLSLFFCLLLDALSLFTDSVFLRQDLSASYLYLLATYFFVFF